MTRKTGQEAKAERLTWFALIMVFVLLSFDETVSVPEVIIPFVIAGILLASSVYQFSQGWQWSWFNVFIAAVLILSGVYDIYFALPVDLVLMSLISVVAILLFGIITNEG